MTPSLPITVLCVVASVLLTAIGFWAALRSGRAVTPETDPQRHDEPRESSAVSTVSISDGA